MLSPSFTGVVLLVELIPAVNASSKFVIRVVSPSISSFEHVKDVAPIKTSLNTISNKYLSSVQIPGVLLPHALLNTNDLSLLLASI